MQKQEFVDFLKNAKFDFQDGIEIGCTEHVLFRTGDDGVEQFLPHCGGLAWRTLSCELPDDQPLSLTHTESVSWYGTRIERFGGYDHEPSCVDTLSSDVIPDVFDEDGDEIGYREIEALVMEFVPAFKEINFESLIPEACSDKEKVDAFFENTITAF